MFAPEDVDDVPTVDHDLSIYISIYLSIYLICPMCEPFLHLKKKTITGDHS